MSKNWFLTKTYRRTIKNSTTGEEAWVELRPLNAGDHCAILDAMQMGADGEEMLMKPQLGHQKLLTVSKALVDWELEGETTLEAVSMLPIDVIDQIFDFVQIPGVPEEEKPEVAADPLPSGSGESEPTAVPHVAAVS